MHTRLRLVKFTFIVLIVLLVAGVFAAPAFALSSTYFKIGTITSGPCTPGGSVNITGHYRVGLADYGTASAEVSNKRTNTYTQKALFFRSFTNGVVAFTGSAGKVPPGTKNGDKLVLRVVMGSYLGYGSTHIIEFKCNSLTIVSANFDDTPSDIRINHDAVPGPLALYCKGNNDLDVYAIDYISGVTELIMRVPKSKIDKVEAGSEHQLIEQAGAVTLWRLSTGEVQINSPFGDEGKVYVFIFNGCPYDFEGYQIMLEPND